MNVILDIDETFVQYVGKDDWAGVPAAEQAKYETRGESSSGLFILRPKFREFFEFLRDNCKTINLWTWSDKEYAEGVKQMIESEVPGASVSNVWHDDDVEASIDLNGHNKDLNYIWYTKKKFQPCDTILVDDLHENTQNPSNIKNGIKIPAFHPLGEQKKQSPTKMRTGVYTDMSKDDTLLKVADIIEKAIKNPTFCEDGDMPMPFKGPTKVGGRRNKKTRRNLRRRLRHKSRR